MPLFDFTWVSRKTQVQRACYFITLLMSVIAQPAHANLITTVSGVPGKGFTTVAFAGSATAKADGSLRSLASVGSSIGDTWRPGPTVSETSSPLPDWFDGFPLFPSNGAALPARSGAASITLKVIIPYGFKFREVPIAGIYLRDFSATIESTDLFGIRASELIEFGSGAEVSWYGSLVVDIDFSVFTPGTYASNDVVDLVGLDISLADGPAFASGPVTLVIERETAHRPAVIPLPATLPLLALGLVILSLNSARFKRAA